MKSSKYKLLIIPLLSIFLSGCDSSSSNTTLDSSFLVGTKWLTHCRVEEPVTFAGITFTNIMEVATYFYDDYYQYEVFQYSDTNCANPTGYSLDIRVSYSLVDKTMTTSGLEAYVTNENIISANVSYNGKPYSILSTNNTTVVDILLIDNNILYYGIEMADNSIPTDLDYNRPFHEWNW